MSCRHPYRDSNSVTKMYGFPNFSPYLYQYGTLLQYTYYLVIVFNMLNMSKLRSRLPSPASSKASAMGQKQSQVNGKKKGILKQMVKPALGGNKFRGTVKPKTGIPKTPVSPDDLIRRYPATTGGKKTLL